jgi:hypothetical protein
VRRTYNMHNRLSVTNSVQWMDDLTVTWLGAALVEASSGVECLLELEFAH